jgi:hypothetical protein
LSKTIKNEVSSFVLSAVNSLERTKIKVGCIIRQRRLNVLLSSRDGRGDTKQCVKKNEVRGEKEIYNF